MIDAVLFLPKNGKWHAFAGLKVGEAGDLADICSALATQWGTKIRASSPVTPGVRAAILGTWGK